MQKSWWEHIYDLLKDVPVAATATGIYIFGVDIKTALSATLMIASAVWAVARAVDVVSSLYWKFKDRRNNVQSD